MESSSTQTGAGIIAALNDGFRCTFIGGSILVSDGVRSEGQAFVAAALSAVRAFNTFDKDNDPHCEHDFGSFSISGKTLFFKIDYYAPDMLHGSEDPGNPQITRRVLMIMLAEEY
jgi:hypothetical protein